MISHAAHAARQRAQQRAQSGRRALGSITVEFALVLPLFLALIFGMIDGSRLMLARWMTSYAVERGGRVASMRGTTTVAQVQTAVVQAAPLITIVGANVNVSVNGVTGTTAFTNRLPGDQIRVWTTYTFNRILRFVFTSATINMSAATLTRVE